MKLFRVGIDSYEFILDNDLIQNKIILFLNKEHLKSYGYFIFDCEYYIDLDFDFSELSDDILYHVNRIKSIERDNRITYLLE